MGVKQPPSPACLQRAFDRMGALRECGGFSVKERVAAFSRELRIEELERAREQLRAKYDEAVEARVRRERDPAYINRQRRWKRAIKIGWACSLMFFLAGILLFISQMTFL